MTLLIWLAVVNVGLKSISETPHLSSKCHPSQAGMIGVGRSEVEPPLLVTRPFSLFLFFDENHVADTARPGEQKIDVVLVVLRDVGNLAALC